MKAALVTVGAALVALLAVPRTVAGVGANAWLDDDVETGRALARGVSHAASADEAVVYKTGNLRFDGQATIAIHQMTLLGEGQLVLAHPEMREELLGSMENAAKHLASPATLAYAARVYHHHGVQRMNPGEGHAYLGYINLGLSMLRLFEPNGETAALNDRLTSELAARIDASPTGLIETYPGETWPPDVAAVVGSIGLHARATGVDRTAFLDRWAKRFERCAVHASTGMLVQRTKSGACTPADAPRGSGTAIAAYFLSFARPALAKKLYAALAAHAYTEVDGFGGFREYPDGFHGGGDTNAGPIVFGVSVGATGFGLAAARIADDRARFRALYRSTRLLGVPTTASGETHFVPGGLLGNALLFAMLTARPS